MTLAEVGIRITYFHAASDNYLRSLGVDRALLPDATAWREWYEVDYARPIQQRENYSLVWLLDDEIIGFSTADQLSYGEQAFMHLHIIGPHHRAAGFGARFVRLSATTYFRVLKLKRLLCQPNAYNIAPNRTLQKAGFRYQFTIETAPGPINFVQPVTRWILEAPPA